MSVKKILRVYLYLTLCCALSPLAVFSQGTSANVNGVITDPSGAVIPEARITARNIDTALTQSVESNSSGFYSISPLPPGNYSITAEHEGFKKYIEVVKFTANQAATINFQLQVGQQTQTVTVNAGEILLNTVNAEISNVVDQHTTTDLPLNGRDPSSLVLLSPGMQNIFNTPGGASWLQTSDSFSNEMGASANGGQQGSTYALLDGIPNMDFYLQLAAPFPNADATQEFRAITNNFGAEYGFSPGAVISIETKSGTNKIHGGLFEFLRNGDLNAANWFSGAVDQLKRNQFGGYIGAPIKKDKLFVFANYQATRQSLAPGTITAFTPTAAMLNGDFSALPETLSAPFLTVNGKPNQVNPDLLSPAAIAITKAALPLGQVPSTGEVIFAGPTVDSGYNEGTARLDYTISDSQRLFVRSFIQQFNFPAANINGNILADQIAYAGKYYNEVISHTWLPKPSLVNVITAAWMSMYVTSGNALPTNTGQPFCFSNYINVADPPGCYTEGFGTNEFSGPWALPNGNMRTTWWLSDHVAKTLGNHIVTAGLDWAHQWDNTTTYYPAPAIILFNGYVTGYSNADFLLGDVSAFQQGAFENSPMRGWQPALYVQDQYKVRPNLMLTAGLRWEPDWAPKSIDSGAMFIPGEQSLRFPQAPTGAVYPGDPGVTSTLRPSDNKYFEPRIGIAWQPLGPKTVLRAGFGLFVAPLSYSFYNQAVGVAPFSPDYLLDASPSSPISLQNPWAGFTATGGKSPFPPFTQNPALPASEAVFLLPVTLNGVFPANFHLPITQSWNASVEQQLTNRIALHLAYVGSETYHQTVDIDRNPGIYANGGNRTTYPNFGVIAEQAPIGTASYNSLQVSVKKQASHGIEFNSSFTWSKIIDISPWGNMPGRSILLPNPFDIIWNRGISELNIPLTSISDFIYTTPTLNGHNNILKYIGGSWEISGIWTFESGQPFGIQGGDGNNNSGALAYGDRADYVPGQPWGVRSGSKAQWLQHYFNPLAFVPNQPGTFGDTGRNFLKGPGMNTSDIALIKNFQFNEQRYNLQFRWEMFNAFNHPNYGLPDSSPTDPNFGQITSTGPIPPRVMQVGLKLMF